jgi:hypothetical protein
MPGLPEAWGKRCPDCSKLKAVTEFGSNAARPDGLAFYCRECFRARAAAHYRKVREAAGATLREPYVGPSDHKRCAECREVKPLTEFHKAPQQSGGYNCYCKICRRRQNREAHLKHTYGISVADFDRMVAEQGGLCACCREREPQHVDHDHLSGDIRGVVCFRCNSGIGQFSDRADLMRNAIVYLERTTWQRQRVMPGVYRLTSPRPGAAPSRSSSELQHLISSRRG